MFSVLKLEQRALTKVLRAPRCRYASTSESLPRGSDSWSRRRNTQEFKEGSPESPNVFTGKAAFYDTVDNLETAVSVSRQALKKLQLYPLPEFALQSLPPAQPAWQNKITLSTTVGMQLTPSRYTRIITLLKQLDEYKRVAAVAGYEDLAASISEVMEVFERPDKDAYLSRGKRNPVEFDEYGRTYTVGRRKESSARVWVIPTRPEAEPTPAPTTPTATEPAGEDAEILLGSLVGSLPGLTTKARPVAPKIPVTQIIVNNSSLAEHLYGFIIPPSQIYLITSRFKF